MKNFENVNRKREESMKKWRSEIEGLKK